MSAVQRPLPLSPDLDMRAIWKRFGDYVALKGVDLRVERGEFIAIMGPSGCGKTTLLRIIAGLETIDSGVVRMRDVPVDDVPVHKRTTRLVWQNYALFPHLSVRNNIAFGLTLKRHDRTEVARKVEAAAAMVQIEPFLDRKPAQLSGGQKQRVAIARALVCEPDILLLDEPLSALDAHLRIKVQAELKRLQQRLGISFIYVTHNQSEAFSMADRVVVMNQGRIEQIGTPQDIFVKPQTRFVAEFVGANNIFDGNVTSTMNGIVRVATGAGTIEVISTDMLAPGQPVALVVQAAKMRRTPTDEPFENRIDVVLTATEFIGSQVMYYLATADGSEIRMIAQEPFGASAVRAGETIPLYWSPEDVVILPAEVSA
ncbi:ABC transporter ATP-binding protein [Zavarzinia sp. CC-PAN008]|uniref:ABC transporter ATP-binding protein n=1 Tax=Zavarzinia sp. CC-PAN008 TaxID=3243332 RepID=UPI003F744730